MTVSVDGLGSGMGKW